MSVEDDRYDNDLLAVLTVYSYRSIGFPSRVLGYTLVGSVITLQDVEDVQLHVRLVDWHAHSGLCPINIGKGYLIVSIF